MQSTHEPVQLRYAGDPILSAIADPIVTEDRPQLEKWLRQMEVVMAEEGGAGLAAPQIGLSKRLFIARDPFSGELKAFINPEMLIQLGDSVQTWYEGCLSVPGYQGKVSRPYKISIEYYGSELEFHKEEFTGPIAGIIAHEYDHLQGILYLSRIENINTDLRSLHSIPIKNGVKV